MAQCKPYALPTMPMSIRVLKLAAATLVQPTIRCPNGGYLARGWLRSHAWADRRPRGRERSEPRTAASSASAADESGRLYLEPDLWRRAAGHGRPADQPHGDPRAYHLADASRARHSTITAATGHRFVRQ